MPTYKELKAVVLRRDLEYIDTERKEGETVEEYAEKLEQANKNERNREIFIWYWLELLPAGATKGKWAGKSAFLALSRIMHPWIPPMISTLPPVMRH